MEIRIVIAWDATQFGTLLASLNGQNHTLQAILAGIQNLQTQGANMASELTTLQAAVAAETTVVASAVTLLSGLKAALDAAIASGDPKALTALSATIGADTKALSDAVAANTPTP